MNRIYKVIYSKVRQCYVVVSEIAKSHGRHTKSSVAKSNAALTAAVLLALGAFSFVGMPSVQAADGSLYRNDYVGTNYKDDNGKSYSSSETKNYHGGGARGVGSNTLGMNAIAGKNTITIGDRDASMAVESVYIGAKYDANNQVHPSSGNNVISVGYGSDAAGTGSIAIGSGAAADAFDNAGKDTNPDASSQSIAIGNNAVAKQNNIAIGAGSVATATASTATAYLTDQAAVSSYVSVGGGTVTTTDPKTKKTTITTTLRRLTNVADGAADTDVATVGQLKKLSDKAGVYNEGWGIKIGDYTKKDANGTETTVKNAISVDRNLGSNEITTKSKNTFKAAGENSLILGGAGTDDLVYINGIPRETQFGAYGKDSVLVGGENNKITDAGTYAVISGGGQNIASGEHSFIGGGWWNTASGVTSAVLGGQSNTASGNQSTIVGGDENRAIGDESTILGGYQHTAIGDRSTISGGDGSYTFGTYSSVSGGQGNVAIGTASSADGGWLNYSYGDYSQVNGGYSNYTLGNASSSLGGRNGVVQGNVSVGIAGGSTEAGAGYALAAGYQSVVTAAGVHREKSNDSVDSSLEAGNDTGGNEGYKYTDVATALGYQATADAPNTVSFGHDKGDVSGYTVNWDCEFETDAQGNMKFDENGMPLVKSLKPNSITTNYYDTAKYNRLVKAADGIEDHDAVVMEQLKNASGVGSKIKVYQMDENGNIKFDENNNPIEDTSDSDAVKTKREAAQKASEDAWGEAIGTGHVADPKASNAKDNGSGQLVTGGTVYDALQKQKTDLTNSLSVNAGWGINIADEKDKDGKVTKKNVVSLDRNLGTNYTDKKHNGDEKVTVSTGTTGLVLGGYAEDEAGNKNNPEVTYGATGVDAVTVGGKNGLASGKGSVVTGGMDNVASGVNSTVVGGDYNDATGTQSVVLGGRDNTASGESSTVNGGGYNVANGIQSVSLGGYSNYALGTGTTSIGGYGKDYQTGYDSSVNGMYSVGIAGGSTGKDAKNSLAAGNQAVVTTENGTAIGYQATTDEANTIAFGHDAGDVSGYTVTWQQLPNGQTNADGTSNDYTKAPTVKETKYGSAFYNRLVKVADGIEDHDAVNVAQLKKLNGMKANVDATNLTNDNVSAWQTKLGNGTVAASNAGLVTGDTVYKETRVSATDAEGNAKTYNYISADNTAGANLESLDTHVKTNADQIGTNTTNISTNTANITKNAGDITDLKNLSNITKDGKNVIKTLSKGSIGMENGSHTTVSKRDVNGVDTYKVDVSVDGEVKEGNSNIVSGGTVYSALQDAQTKMDGDLAGKANVNASNIGSNITVDPIYKTDDNGKKVIDQDATDAAAKKAQTENANAWGTAIGTGTVAKDNGQLVTGKTVYDALHGGLDDLVIGHAGKDGKDGQDGSIGLVGQTGAKGEDGKNAYATTIIKTEKGADGVDGKNGEDGITRIVYNDTNDPSKQQTVATLDDGMKFKGDDKTVIAKKLNNTLEIIGGADNTKLTDNNIGVNSTTDGKLKIQLAKDLTGMNSTTYTKTTGTGDSATTSTTVVDGNGLTIKSTVTKDGKTETVNGPSVTKDGIDAGNKQITNISNGIEKDSNGKYTITDQNKGNAANVSDVQNIVNDAKKDLTDGANGLNSKANVDASNIGENMKDAKGNKASAAEITKNKEAWASAIGTDTVAKGNKQLVTSDAVATALDSKADKTYVDKQLDTKANKSDVYTKDQTYSKSEVDSKVSDITTGLDGKAGKDLDNISDKGQQVIHNIAKDAVEVVDGTNTTVTKTEGTNTAPTKYAVNVEGKGKVASGDTGLISGDTLYKEVHVDTDGSYIKGSQSVGQNLSNLDTGLKTTSDLIHTNAKGDTIQIGGNSTATKIDISGKDKDGKSTGRVITGVVSDVNDPNSAANVGYVNGITSASNEQIYHDMNMQYNHVENDISRAAAGSNALAALHPMQEFDPDDKAQFALGYGHYRNSNAGAVGAFYQPDENSLFSFGVSFGNGDAGLNAGVTFKFGPGGSDHHALTKTQMAKVIDAQSKEIDELKKDNADKDKRIDALEQKMTEILAKLDKSKD